MQSNELSVVCIHVFLFNYYTDEDKGHYSTRYSVT